jgi:SnoaL-like domain
MPYPTSLSGLSTREQLIDVVLRGALSFDENDEALFNSCWPTEEPEKVFVSIVGTEFRGVEEFRKCFQQVGPMDTQHNLSNFRVEVEEGASTAKLYCHAFAQHFRPGEGTKPGAPNFLAVGVYDIDAIKEKGEWKIKNWSLRLRWSQGDYSVMGRS